MNAYNYSQVKSTNFTRGCDDTPDMKDEKKQILLVMPEGDERDSVEKELKAQSYSIILATNNSEARLKLGNAEYKFLIIEDNIKGINTVEFLKNIRRKEGNGSLKEALPIMLIGPDAMIFNDLFQDIKDISFLEQPFNQDDFRTKLLVFTGNANAITENTTIVKAGDYLITEGGISHEMFWVISGHFKITKLNKQDQNVVIGEIFPGELVGEMSFLDSLPRSASVRAEKDSEVLSIPHKKFINIFDSQPGWFRSLMKTLSKRLREANTKMSQKQINEDP